MSTFWLFKRNLYSVIKFLKSKFGLLSFFKVGLFFKVQSIRKCQSTKDELHRVPNYKVKSEFIHAYSQAKFKLQNCKKKKNPHTKTKKLL